MRSRNIFSVAALMTALFVAGCSEDEAPARRDINPPRLVENTPLGYAKNVPRNTAIIVKFNEEMDYNSINNSTFFLKQGSVNIPGEVVYSGTTATFTPTTALDALTDYTATITTGTRDLSNNAPTTDLVWMFTTGGSTSALSAIDLGDSGDFVILATSAISNVSTSTITGDLGISPAPTSNVTGLSVTDASGYATSPQVSGRIYASDMEVPTPVVLNTAIGDMIDAYEEAKNRRSPDFAELASGVIGGRTLSPGLYNWTNAVSIPSNITISGGANDVWIFQIAGDLSVSPSVSITLSGGAQAKNIFWQVAGQAIIGNSAHVAGNILSMTSITFQTGASITGRALARTAVVLDANAVSNL